MKNLNQSEVEMIADWVGEKVARAQVQAVLHFEKGLGLELYTDRTWFLVFDLSKTGPFFYIFDQSPWPKSRKTKPLGLFVNAHAKNLELESIQVLQDYGRVVLFNFISRHRQEKAQAPQLKEPAQRSCQIEFHMIPKRLNLLARTEDKSIAWAKPMPLEKWSATTSFPAHNADEAGSSLTQHEAEYEARSLSTLKEEWLQLQKSTTVKKGTGYQIQSAAPGDALKKQWLKDLAKKEKALGEIENQIQENIIVSEKLYEAGQSLKWKSLKEVLAEQPELKELKSDASVSENMEKVFQKAKSLIKKNDGAEKRLLELRKEIAGLRRRIESNVQETDILQKMDQDKARLAIPDDIQARKKTLSANLVAYKGKSAKDNLSLLRSAKSWDYWFHLKDYPGAYAILRRNKNQAVSAKDIQELSAWMVEDVVSKKESLRGVAINVVYAECRYVRPIKGDRLGRVQYQSEKTVRVKID